MKEIIEKLEKEIKETEEDECRTVFIGLPHAYSILKALKEHEAVKEAFMMYSQKMGTENGFDEAVEMAKNITKYLNGC